MPHLTEPITAELEYMSADGEVTERRVDIYRTKTENSRTYFTGYCYNAEDERTFRSDRVRVATLDTGEVLSREDFYHHLRNADTSKVVIREAWLPRDQQSPTASSDAPSTVSDREAGETIIEKLTGWYFGLAIIHGLVVGFRNNDWIAGAGIFALYCIVAWVIRRSWKRRHPD